MIRDMELAGFTGGTQQTYIYFVEDDPYTPYGAFFTNVEYRPTSQTKKTRTRCSKAELIRNTNATRYRLMPPI